MTNGAVYVLHFDRAVGAQSGHYTGLTKDLDARLDQHRRGVGSDLTRRARAAMIGWTLVLTITPATGLDERAVKRTQAARFCPLCGGKGPDGLPVRLRDRVVLHV